MANRKPTGCRTPMSALRQKRRGEEVQHGEIGMVTVCLTGTSARARIRDLSLVACRGIRELGGTRTRNGKETDWLDLIERKGTIATLQRLQQLVPNWGHSVLQTQCQEGRVRSMITLNNFGNTGIELVRFFDRGDRGQINYQLTAFTSRHEKMHTNITRIVEMYTRYINPDFVIYPEHGGPREQSCHWDAINKRNSLSLGQFFEGREVCQRGITRVEMRCYESCRLGGTGMRAPYGLRQSEVTLHFPRNV